MRVNFAGAAAAAVAAVTLAQITDMDAGMRAFNATPSSANLAAAVTDETGTGALVFGTTPTLATPKISDGAGHAYRLVPGTLAADRDLNLPVLGANDTIVVAAATQTLANKTFTAPVLGDAVATSLASSAANVSTTGFFRLPTTSTTVFMAVRNNGLTADRPIIAGNGTDVIQFGSANLETQLSGTPAKVFANGSLVATFATSLNTLVNPTTITKGAIAATSTDGLSLVNATAATSGVPVQYSTRFVQTGTAYNSVSTLSETQSWMHEVRPVTVAGATTSTFAIACSLNGGGYLDRMILSTSGTTTFAGAVGAVGLSSTAQITATNARIAQTLSGTAVTSTDGVLLQTTTAATVGTTMQYSPRLRFQGNAWNSVGAASETQDWIIENRPITNAGATVSTLAFARSLNGGAYADEMTISSNGTTTIAGQVTAAQFNATASSGFFVNVAGSQFSSIRVDAAGATTDCFIAKNAGAAAAASQRWSPALHLTGAGWNVTAAASRVVDARTYIIPIQQASNEPTVEQVFDMQVNATGYTTVLTLVSTGGFKLPTASATPPNPPAGSVAVWFDGTNLKAKNSAGTAVTWA